MWNYNNKKSTSNTKFNGDNRNTFNKKNNYGYVKRAKYNTLYNSGIKNANKITPIKINCFTNKFMKNLHEDKKLLKKSNISNQNNNHFIKRAFSTDKNNLTKSINLNIFNKGQSKPNYTQNKKSNFNRYNRFQYPDNNTYKGNKKATNNANAKKNYRPSSALNTYSNKVQKNKNKEDIRKKESNNITNIKPVETKKNNDSNINNFNDINTNTKSKEEINKKRPPSADKINKITLGLVNIGLSCYMNSVIQFFFNIKDFREPILKGNFNENSITYHLKRIFEYLSGKTDTKNFNNPYFSSFYSNEQPNGMLKDFQRIVSAENPMFSHFKAADSKDFLLFLLEIMHNELNTKKEVIFKLPQMNTNNLTEVIQNVVYKYYNENDSVISELFYIFTLSIITCKKCNATTYNLQYQNFIEIDIVKAITFQSNMVNMMNMIGKSDTVLNHYNKLPKNNYNNLPVFNLESYFILKNNPKEDNMYCIQCHKNYPTSIMEVFYSFPNTIIINFNYGKNLINPAQVILPEILDMSKFVQNNSSYNNGYSCTPNNFSTPNFSNNSVMNFQNMPCNSNFSNYINNTQETLQSSQLFNPASVKKFLLTSVVVHRGASGDSGHYVAYVKKNNDWLELDDKIVSKVNFVDIMNTKDNQVVYLAAYVKY